MNSGVLAFAACLVTGAALYVTRGVLDQVVTPGGALRVAFLPPWQSLIGFTLLAAVGLLWLHHRHAPRGTSTTAVPPRIGMLVLPAFGLGLLLLPYLPFLPDRWPLLQALAGPARGLVWLVVIAQLAWVSWQLRPARLRWMDGAPLWQLSLFVGVTVALLSGGAAARLTSTVLFPAGDEPHYLVISQSLWRDGDLKIENNHERGDYREYFAQELEPHYLTRGSDGEIYSIHPIGVSVLMAPVYALGGYPLVVFVLVLVGASAAALAWRWIAMAAGPGPATFAVAAVAATSPYLLNSFAVYPEIVAGLAAIVGLTAVTSRAPRLAHWVACGVACAALPWLSSKYALMSGTLFLVGAYRAWQAARGVRGALVPVAAMAVPYGLSVLGWFAFFYAYWGSPLPSAPYGAMLQTSPKNLVFGAPGLFFDQEYGLLAYAPVYAIAASGLWTMWKAGGESRQKAVEVVLIFGALVATVGAFRIWWGGSAAPGRPIASGLLLLALPVALAFRSAGAGTPRRALHHALLWISIGFTLVLVFAQNGLLIANDRDGTSRLVEYLSPRWEAWTLLPSFIHHEAGTALVHALAWVALALAAGWAVSRARPSTPGQSSLLALASVCGVVAAVSAVMPLLPAKPPQPSVDLNARSRLELLDDFDRAALPNAIVYDPFRPAEPADTEPMLHLAVSPGLRRDPQPIRVLHNGRFSLPAGEYAVAVRWTDNARAGAPAALALQVGRIGPPLFSWAAVPVPGGEWRATFGLPADANFVALRGTPEVEQHIASITFTPLSIVDAGLRPRTPTVLSTQTYGDVMVLFHDEQSYPEGEGFWTFGGRSTQVTLAFRSDRPRVLRVHSGSIPNRAVLTMHGWQEVVDLLPGKPREITLPPGPPVADLSIATTGAFVPSAQDSSVTDHRSLGIWIEVPR